MSVTVHTLVTGASSGIGRSTAVRLSQQRALVLHGRNEQRLEETRALCASPDTHVVWPFDLRNVSDISASLLPLLAASGRAVDAFVHCAGIATVLPARSVNYRVAQESMDINCVSAMEIVNLLLKKSVNSGRLANIIFISSIWSQFGSRAHAAYCASKAALDGAMRAFAVELAPAIRVNSILPGAIETSMAAGGFADTSIVEKLQKDYPLGLGQTNDIADAVEFLLSDRARWITGQQLVVDGGRTANMSLK